MATLNAGQREFVAVTRKAMLDAWGELDGIATTVDEMRDHVLPRMLAAAEAAPEEVRDSVPRRAWRTACEMQLLHALAVYSKKLGDRPREAFN